MKRRWIQRALLMVLAACWALHASAAPARFLLSFDDGPRPGDDSPTAQILDVLASAQPQPIKAIFFVQVHERRRGGHPEGPALMQREALAGHVLALHSLADAGHVPHPRYSADQLAPLLRTARSDLQALAQEPIDFIRPPDWAYSDATQAVYRQEGLHMLLTDLSANDGKIYGWTWSLRRRSHFRHELALVAAQQAQNTLPVVDGVSPVVVTFHDTNHYTAEHMADYLSILREEAVAAGLELDAQPFYTDREALKKAAQARSEAGRYVCDGGSRSVSRIKRWFGSAQTALRECF